MDFHMNSKICKSNLDQHFFPLLLTFLLNQSHHDKIKIIDSFCKWDISDIYRLNQIIEIEPLQNPIVYLTSLIQANEIRNDPTTKKFQILGGLVFLFSMRKIDNGLRLVPDVEYPLCSLTQGNKLSSFRSFSLWKFIFPRCFLL